MRLWTIARSINSCFWRVGSIDRSSLPRLRFSMLLSNGGKSILELVNAKKVEGSDFSWRTVQRAMKNLGVQNTWKEGTYQYWLPSANDKPRNGVDHPEYLPPQLWQTP